MDSIQQQSTESLLPNLLAENTFNDTEGKDVVGRVILAMNGEAAEQDANKNPWMLKDNPRWNASRELCMIGRRNSSLQLVLSWRRSP